MVLVIVTMVITMKAIIITISFVTNHRRCYHYEQRLGYIWQNHHQLIDRIKNTDIET